MTGSHWVGGAEEGWGGGEGKRGDGRRRDGREEEAIVMCIRKPHALYSMWTDMTGHHTTSTCTPVVHICMQVHVPILCMRVQFRKACHIYTPVTPFSNIAIRLHFVFTHSCLHTLNVACAKLLISLDHTSSLPQTSSKYILKEM